MLWLCCEFTLGDKLVYWSAALWAFFGWTVRCLQPNGEGRRACSYLSLFSLVCAQQSDFDRRKSHETWCDEARCDPCLLLTDRHVPGYVLCPGCWVLTWLLPIRLPTKLSSLITWTISLSLGHSSLPLKKGSPYLSETSASTYNTAQCGSSEDRGLFVIDSFQLLLHNVEVLNGKKKCASFTGNSQI